MAQRLPYSRWIAAQEELQDLVERTRSLDVPGLHSMMERALRTLRFQAYPSLAALELEYSAAFLRQHQPLREAVLALARRLMPFGVAETKPSAAM